jgi:ATP-dependent RNA helicase DeaD
MSVACFDAAGTPCEFEVPLSASSESASSGEPSISFSDLNLSEAVLAALQSIGYESPSPIQAATIPPLLAGSDLVGQAQTGTGKTAAFALPILSKIDPRDAIPRALVLAPTRELAIQVAEAFQRYASQIPGFHVLPIYGGQSYTPQLQRLRRGVHVVVGTPGRVMDHIKRGTLSLDGLEYLVLDEADEMLRMGFIDDVEWILEHVPEQRQIALFSATMPTAIRRIAQKYLREPVEVTIKTKTTTASKIRQRYWMVSGVHKLDALTRILEAESFDGMIIFTRTKQATEELAERLQARGYAAEALNGDIAQAQRERTVGRLKSGQIDIVVATDVAARGLDVERVSHVVNFDIPYDPESYVHRIGRTGRAGRSGEAILFVAPRERNMLRVIERATRQPIEPMQLPTIADVNEQRIARFTARIVDTLAAEDLSGFRDLIASFEQQHNVPLIEIAAALAVIAQGGKPLFLEDKPAERKRERAEEAHAPREECGKRERRERAAPSEAAAHRERPAREPRPERRPREEASRPERAPRSERVERAQDETRPRLARREREDSGPEAGMETFRIEVGHVHGVRPSNIVGAIANESGLDGRDIGRVVIREDHSFVDLPEGMPKDVFRALQKVWVSGQKLQISRALRAQVDRLERGDRRDGERRPPHKSHKSPKPHRRKA